MSTRACTCSEHFFALFSRMESCVAQFRRGLGSLEPLLRTVRICHVCCSLRWPYFNVSVTYGSDFIPLQHTETMMPLLVSLGSEDITSAAQFRSLYDVEWSEEGSNMRGAEMNTIFAFELFLTKIGKPYGETQTANPD